MRKKYENPATLLFSHIIRIFFMNMKISETEEDLVRRQRQKIQSLQLIDKHTAVLLILMIMKITMTLKKKSLRYVDD